MTTPTDATAPTADDVRAALAEAADPARAASSARFFKTGPGEYGEGDRFIGVTVPATRAVAKRFATLPLDGVGELLADPEHEHRLCALVILVARFDRASAARTRDDGERAGLARFHLAAVRAGRVDNWDLVDVSADRILGEFVRDPGAMDAAARAGLDLALLDELAASGDLWERRVAIMSTFAFLKHGDAAPTLRLAERLLDDPHDLIHKATGWMRVRPPGGPRDAHRLPRRERPADAAHHAVVRDRAPGPGRAGTLPRHALTAAADGDRVARRLARMVRMSRTARGAHILITGAAGGMGRMYAQRAVAEGAASVVLWDRDAQGLARTADELGAAARGRTQVRSYAVDVSELGAIAKAAHKVRREVGDPDVLVNNAGIVRGNRYFWESHAGDDVRPTMLVNALAPMYVTHEFLPGMIRSDRPARIVNIGSAAGTLANPRMAVYAASKAALNGWSDSLRLELQQAGHRHITVTTVTPSYISTGMFHGARGPLLAPILEPEYVVDRVWRAMLDGRPLVELPRSVRLSRALRGLLPTRVFDRVVGDGFGVYRSMEEFRGRG